MIRKLLVTAAFCLLLTTALGGCFGKEKGSDKGSGSESPGATTATPNNNTTIPNLGGNVTVTIIQYTNSTTTNGSINVTWEVGLVGTSNDSANASTQTNHTDVHYGMTALNSTPTGWSAYSNQTLEQSGPLPGTFNTTITAGGTGTMYLRAHAFVAGGNYWSDEVMVNVTAANTSKTWNVQITGTGPLAKFDPTPLTIKVGDGVNWTNKDTSAFSHKSKSDISSGVQWDTGTIASGKTSATIYFNKAGTYTYTDGGTGATVKGTITVK